MYLIGISFVVIKIFFRLCFIEVEFFDGNRKMIVILIDKGD